MAFFIPHGDGDAGLTDGVAEGAATLFRGAFPGKPLHGVVRDEVDFGVQALGDLHEMGCVFQRVVYVPDEDVFQRGHLVPVFSPFLQSGDELGKRPFFVDRHDLAAYFVRGSVQGDSQPYLPGVGGQFFQARHESGGGDGDMARAYFQPAVGGDDFQSVMQVVKVGEGFPHSHENEVVDPFPGNGFRGEYLSGDFPRGEVAPEPQQAGSAEFAAEGAAHLGGDAEGGPVCLFSVLRNGGGDDDGFHQTAVFHPGEEFARGTRSSADFHNFRRMEAEVFRQQASERRGEVGHGVKGGDALAPDPVHDLLDAEFGMAALREEGQQLFLRLRGDQGERVHGRGVPVREGSPRSGPG